MGLLQKERVLTYLDTPKTILTQRSIYKLTAELPPMVRILGSHSRDPSSSPGNRTTLLGNRADLGLILLHRTNKRPTVLTLSATTCEQVAVSPETAMGCRRIRFLQAEREINVPCPLTTYKT